MDKLVFNGTTTTISNDGATIMKLLDIVHPAARTLVDIARSQDEEVCLCYTQLKPPSHQPTSNPRHAHAHAHAHYEMQCKQYRFGTY
jgi:hypothetical protein